MPEDRQTIRGLWHGPEGLRRKGASAIPWQRWVSCGRMAETQSGQVGVHGLLADGHHIKFFR